MKIRDFYDVTSDKDLFVIMNQYDEVLYEGRKEYLEFTSEGINHPISDIEVRTIDWDNGRYPNHMVIYIWED